MAEREPVLCCWSGGKDNAMALFSGAVIGNRLLAFVFPLIALLAGDFVIGFHILMPVVYASFLLSICIGFWLREHRTILGLGEAVLVGAVQFFVITNLGAWLFLNSYPKTLGGLVACYIAGVPWFWNTLAGDALFSGLLFGALFLAERRFSAVRTRKVEVFNAAGKKTRPRFRVRTWGTHHPVTRHPLPTRRHLAGQWPGKG
jgi:hypothetical protein